jgi:hypothetical protein
MFAYYFKRSVNFLFKNQQAQLTVCIFKNNAPQNNRISIAVKNESYRVSK